MTVRNEDAGHDVRTGTAASTGTATAGAAGAPGRRAAETAGPPAEEGRTDPRRPPAARTSRWRPRRRPADLELRPFPEIGTGDPAAQREALAALRTWAEQGAEDAIDWYLRDKKRKRVGSRLLQGLAIAFAVAGTAIPLGTSAAGGSGQGWGYVLLAVAAGCKAYDHFFGLSSTWMRDIAVAQALRTELTAVRLEWATDVLRAGRAAARPDEWLQPSEVERQLALINRLVTAVRQRMDSETAEWQSEFRSRTRQLAEQGAFAGGLSAVPDRAPGL